MSTSRTRRTTPGRTTLTGFDGAQHHWIKADGSEPKSVFLGFTSADGQTADAVKVAPRLEVQHPRTTIAGYDGTSHHWIKSSGSEPGSVFLGFTSADGQTADAVKVAPRLEVQHPRTTIAGYDGTSHHWIKSPGSEPGSVFLGFASADGQTADAVKVAPRLELQHSRTSITGYDAENNHWFKAPGNEPDSVFVGFISADGLKADAVRVEPELRVGRDLSVQGDIHVDGALHIRTWTLEVPDYVFERDYRLRSLEELSRFIDSRGHLPDVPSADAVREGGLDLGEFSMALLRKVEELTLYVLEQQRAIAALRERIATLEPCEDGPDA